MAPLSTGCLHLGAKIPCGTLDFDMLMKTLNRRILSSQQRGLGFRIEEYQTCILWPIFLANNAIAENNQNVHILWHLIPVVVSMGESARLAPSSSFYVVTSAFLGCKSFKIGDNFWIILLKSCKSKDLTCFLD